MSKIGNLLPQVTEFFKNKPQTTSERTAGNQQNFGNSETSIGNLTKTIQTYQNAKLNAAVKSAKGDEKITVVMNGQTPEAHAEAILKHYGFSKADEKAFQEKFGYDLRKNLTATYRRHDIKSVHKPLGNNRYQVQIPIPKSLLAQIEAVKPQAKSFDVPLPPTTTAAASPKPIPQPLPTPISPTQTVGKDVSKMGMAEKLEIVINKAIEHLGPEAGEKLKQLLTPENMAIMVGTTAALIAVQGVPFLDVAVDAIVLGVAAYSLGSEALSAIGDIADFASKTFNAKTEADLDEAGKSLAKATATIGVDALAALLIHKGVKSIKAGEIPPPNTKVVEMVTPEGVRVKVRVPVEEPITPQKGSNVLESRTEKSISSGKIRPEPGTPEHKALRWQEYETKNLTNPKKLSYETWSKIYDVNMQQANKSNIAVKAYQEKLGWGKTEVTVEVEPGVNRRLDIADVTAKKAVEHKTGYTSLDEDIKWEVARDKKLVDKGWKITWHFEGTASKPLVEALKAARINITYGNKETK